MTWIIVCLCVVGVVTLMMTRVPSSAYETYVYAGLFYILRPGQRLGHCCRNQVTFLLILLKIYIYFKILCLLNRSTGLTCSLALSQYVSERLSKQLYLGFFNFRAF